ncbi:MAG: hypothetical protein NTZ34_06375 [Chloroflexi bacterium]|nr:hypothetical protein [Chloroflexota bacterium]
MLANISLVKKSIIVIVLALPAVIAFLFIARYGVNVVFGDQWDFVPLWDKFYSGTLSFNDLTIQINEHRALVYYVIMLMLGSITHWNNVAEMFFSWVLLCLICFVIYKIYTRSCGTSWAVAARFIPVTWMMFNLLQFESLLSGIQIACYIMILSFLLAVYLLQTSRGLDWRFFIAVFCGVIGAYSLANGLLIWIIGLFQLLFIWVAADAASKKVYLISLMVWSAFTVAIYFLYFWSYQKPVGTPSLLYFVQQPLIAVAYGLAAIGSLFGINHTYIAIAAGLLLVVLYTGVAIIILKDLKVKLPQLPCLALILFTGGSVLLLVLSRSGFGIEQALSSRYISFTVIGIIGLYLAITSLPQKFINIRSLTFRAAISLLLLFLLSLDMYILLIPGKTYLIRQLSQQYLMTYQSQSDENLKILYYNRDPAVVRQYAPILMKYRLNVFYRTE